MAQRETVASAAPRHVMFLSMRVDPLIKCGGIPEVIDQEYTNHDHFGMQRGAKGLIDAHILLRAGANESAIDDPRRWQSLCQQRRPGFRILHAISKDK